MTRKPEVRAGIIGVGGIAMGKHLPALAKLDNVKITAFYDIDKERALKGLDQFGAPGAKVYEDYHDLLAAKLDVVHICTPNNSHATIAIEALQAGKHVMCEKPMATTAADARRMVAAARAAGKKLTIGYQQRYRPDSLYVKKLVEQGELGDIYYAKALALRRRGVPTWGVFLDKGIQGGGPMIDIGTHALDLTLWLMNNYEPEYAVGAAFYKLGARPNAVNSWGPWDPAKFEVEDSALGFVKFKNGAALVLETSWALNTLQESGIAYVLCGTEAGADYLDGLRINGEKHGRLYTEKIDLNACGGEFNDLRGLGPGEIEAKLWIDAIVNDTDPVVKMEQALVVCEILDAIYESSETGQPVYFTGERALAGV